VDFELSEEQGQLQDVIRRFLSERYAEGMRARHRASPSGYCNQNWQALADLGLLALPLPAQEGGLGGGPVELMVLMEALGRGLAAEPVLEEIVVAAGVLARAGSPVQRQHWLPAVMSGEAHLALAHFEHPARFELSHVETRAHGAEGATLLTGEKPFVLAAGAADAFIVSARESGEVQDPSGLGLYLVPAKASGLERRAFRLCDGSVANAIVMRDSAAQKLGGGFAELAAAVDLGRIGAGAEMLGLMSTMFESTVAYLQARKQFGAPLASLQVIQHRLADLYVLLEQSRSHLYRAALGMDGGRDGARAIAAMKSFISAAATEMGEQCIHLHGGIGIADELAVGHGHKRLLVLGALFGDSDYELQRYIRLAA
jgi:alkylation response protein AidB-like acyl-CoA dehydrogenase